MSIDCPIIIIIDRVTREKRVSEFRPNILNDCNEDLLFSKISSFDRKKFQFQNTHFKMLH